jgi:hypothetical protein
MTSGAVAGAAVAGLFLAAAVSTYRDFNGRWLNDPRVAAVFERPTLQAIQYVERQSRAALSRLALPQWAYLAPTESADPFVRFAQHVLKPARVGGFDSARCLMVPATPALYLIETGRDPGVAAELARWGTAETLAAFGGPGDAIAVVHLTPKADVLQPAGDRVARFGQAFEIRSQEALTTSARPGDLASWQLRVSAVRPLDRPYSVFLHLYRVASDGAIDDRSILAQGDRQVCASHPTSLWRPGEVAVETYNLHLPADLSSGQYVVAMGVYDSDTGERLSVDPPGETARSSYSPLQHILIQR